MSKLKFTNDCDPDLTIWELQHENEKLLKQIEDAEEVISEIYEDSNPAYLVDRKEKYFKEYTDEI